jgi:hypothetical protein
LARWGWISSAFASSGAVELPELRGLGVILVANGSRSQQFVAQSAKCGVERRCGGEVAQRVRIGGKGEERVS